MEGGSATTIQEAGFSGIRLEAPSGTSGNLALTVGSMGPVRIVRSSGSSAGIYLGHESSGTATVDIRDNVTIGTMATRMTRHGIELDFDTAADVTVTTAADIYSGWDGIEVNHRDAGTVTFSNSGDIDALEHALDATISGAGAMTVSNSGDLTAAGADKRGINVLAEGSNHGAVIVALTGGRIESAAAQGVYVDSQGTGAVTIQGTDANAESGPTIMAATHGIHVSKADSGATAGNISITTTGGSITTGDGNGIFVEDNAGHTGSVTIDNAAGIMASQYGILVDRAGMGAVSVTHRAGEVLGLTQAGIRAENVGGSSDVTVAIMGGMVRSTGQGGSAHQNGQAIHARNRGTGDVIVTIAAGATASSRHDAGIFARLGSYDGQVKVTQSGAILGRTGVLARAPHHATAETVVPRQATAQPVIDIAWTGTFADG